jgi:hypothetical protein
MSFFGFIFSLMISFYRISFNNSYGMFGYSKLCFCLKSNFMNFDVIEYRMLSFYFLGLMISFSFGGISGIFLGNNLGS